MPTPTYDLIEEKVLSSAQASVTFSSIPGTYKDLVLECVFIQSNSGQDMVMQYNGDTSALYSTTILRGYGTSGTGTANSQRSSGATFIYTDWTGRSTSVLNTADIQIMSYANTNVNKTCIIRSGNAGSTDTAVEATVGLWRSTSAITSVLVKPTAGNFNSGGTFRLWGVAG